MKKFKKISAIFSGLLMVGMTAGIAAAAAYPAPFVDNGVADVAVVYGTGAGVSSLDMTQAQSIQTSLSEYVEGETTVTGGEAFTLEKSSDKFNYGDAMNVTHPTLDYEEMDFLADGTYDDGDIDEDYEQTITLGDQTLGLFADNDYENDEPTVGFKYNNGDDVLTYKIEFDSAINFSAMEDTDMPLLGGEYYVLEADATAGTLTLLDSAEKTILSEGETVIVGGKTVSIDYISSTEVKFSVDGETTDKLADHEYYELEDESYIVANEILYSDKEAGISKVEFSIGAGKMVLESGKDIEINDEDLDGMAVTFGGSVAGEAFTYIQVAWNSDDESFLTESNSLVMPGFGAIQLVYNGLDYGSDSEDISLDNGETLVLNMGNYDIDLMWFSTTNDNTTMGAEDYELILAEEAVLTFSEAGYEAGDLVPKNSTAGWFTATLSDGSTVDAFNSTNTSDARLATTYLTTVLPVDEDQRFIATRIDTDLSDVETLYYEVTDIDATDSTTVLALKDLIGDNDLDFDALLDDKDRGDVNVVLTAFNADNTTAYLDFTPTGGSIEYNKAISEKGLVATLPTSSNITTTDADRYSVVTFTEADHDGDIEAGVKFTAKVKLTSNDKLHVSSTNVSTEEITSDKYIGYVSSDLASIVNTDQSADEYDFSIEYFGEETTADVKVVTGGAVLSTAGALGDVLLMDTEASTATANNLIIVGGSCINSAAATVLGGAYCGEAFTTATGVGVDQFLIKGYDNVYGDKFALVVAGYEMADTVNAATYLTMQKPDTSEALLGTSATSAELMVA